MRPAVVVVGHEFAEDREQVVLVDDDDVVEAPSAWCPDHALDDRVRTRCRHGRGDGEDDLLAVRHPRVLLARLTDTLCYAA
jgi:hypothetical protein